MKKILIAVFGLTLLGLGSCKKCSECHYDFNDEEVELGEFCDDELEEKEENGHQVNGVTYEVHCHDH